MKLRFLLFYFLLMAGMLASAQDTIRSLIISEAHLGAPGRNYVEITNMGNEPVQLNKFKFGSASLNNYFSAPNRFIVLPDRMLQPGESFLIAEVFDFRPKAYALGYQGFPEWTTPPEIMSGADIRIHVSDYDWTNNPTKIPLNLRVYDTVSFANPLDMYFGRQAVYLQQYLENGDSVVVDQVMGVWDTAGTGANAGLFGNKAMAFDGDAYDVAGFPNAGSYAHLIRKFSVKQGNLEFVRGNSENDSEWIALPIVIGQWRAQPWTIGSHADSKLNENTLESDIVDVDFANKVLTVPWGLRRPDDIMKSMKKKPGIYWSYRLSDNHEDSLSFAIKTGDSLSIVVTGSEAYRATFSIVVKEPTASTNIIVPRVVNTGVNPIAGNHDWPRVTRNESGTDSITGSGLIHNLGIPFATRVDSLIKRLEKPTNASWEIVPLDGNKTRPDLINGDKIKVLSENGSIKEYFIKVKNIERSNNAWLSSIVWPDILDAELFEALYGWKGDTIPSFMPSTFNYQLKLPFDIQSVPALVAKSQDLNAKIVIKRAISLTGTQEDRTTVFTVTAPDDSTTFVYRVEWQQEVSPENIQPFQAEPFISEYVAREYFNNDYLEVINPGNLPLDLSNYMIVSSPSANPAEAIAFNPEAWGQRYRKYVPGYKWVDEVNWAFKPGFLVPDIAVNPIVEGGDVFVLSEITQNGWFGFGNTGWSANNWPGINESDVQFYNNAWPNPWGEFVQDGFVPIASQAGQIQYIFKILNDSVKAGLKAATDPNDFELIDIMGMVNGSRWTFGYPTFDDGHDFASFRRKPHINKGNTVLQASFGDSPATTEWQRVNRRNSGIGGWPMQWIVTVVNDLGKHYFIPSTDYKSTILSRSYKVSEGYKIEDIKGITTGTTVDDFLSRIIKANEGQTLKVKSTANGAELGMNAILSNSDTLVVLSADGINTTKYVLVVTERGLSTNAILTSDEYFISVEVTTGGIYNIPVGTKLSEAVANVALPVGATMAIINDEDAWVPFKKLNFDTTYVDIMVSNKVFFEVVAEDGTTKIVYQLIPFSEPSDAYVLSDLYLVDQALGLIQFVPRGTDVQVFMRNLIPASGATIKVVDKSGLQRTRGNLYQDDKLVVTSMDGKITKVYYLDMLRTINVVTGYLAYVISDDYQVDQLNKVIASPVALTTVSDFLNKLTPAFGASLAIYNKEGQPNSTGVLNKGDVLQVTSFDGKTIVYYSLTLDVTSVDQLESGFINVYPNPTSGKVSISGVEAGSKVRVFNMMGAPVSEFVSRSSIETISLENQASGIYFIVVSNNERINGTYKLIKK